MVLTALFIIAGLVGVIVLATEVRTIAWRRRVERRWREEDRRKREERHDRSA